MDGHHPSEKLIAECYDRLARGDMAGVIAMCDKSMVYKCFGSSLISGTFDNATIGNHMGQVMQLCNGTFKQSVMGTVANDYGGMSLVNSYFERNGQPIELRTMHIWKINEGKFVSWEEYPGSETEFNRAWA
jgi:ketosteroid isomerase-like protein